MRFTESTTDLTSTVFIPFLYKRLVVTYEEFNKIETAAEYINTNKALAEINTHSVA